MNRPDTPIAHEGLFVTHFFTVKDQEKSKDFYARILGGKVIKPENPCHVKLANTWIILNSGGGPTPDKPEALLEIPSDLIGVNSFLNLRVVDISLVLACFFDSDRECGASMAGHESICQVSRCPERWSRAQSM